MSTASQWKGTVDLFTLTVTTRKLQWVLIHLAMADPITMCRAPIETLMAYQTYCNIERQADLDLDLSSHVSTTLDVTTTLAVITLDVTTPYVTSCIRITSRVSEMMSSDSASTDER